MSNSIVFLFLLSTSSPRLRYVFLCFLHDFTSLLCYLSFVFIDYSDPTILSFTSLVQLRWRCPIKIHTKHHRWTDIDL